MHRQVLRTACHEGAMVFRLSAQPYPRSVPNMITNHSTQYLPAPAYYSDRSQQSMQSYLSGDTGLACLPSCTRARSRGVVILGTDSYTSSWSDVTSVGCCGRRLMLAYLPNPPNFRSPSQNGLQRSFGTYKSPVTSHSMSESDKLRISFEGKYSHSSPHYNVV